MGHFYASFDTELRTIFYFLSTRKCNECPIFCHNSQPLQIPPSPPRYIPTTLVIRKLKVNQISMNVEQ